MSSDRPYAPRLRPVSSHPSAPAWATGQGRSTGPRVNFAAIAERSRERGGGPFGNGGGAPRSLVAQVSDAVQAIPSGLAGFAKGVAEVPVGFGRLGYDAVRGEDFSEDYGTNLGEYFPILEQMRGSLTGTGRSLSELGVSLAPGGLSPSDTEYGDSIREGRIVDRLLEDVSNAALVGGVTARALTGAGSATGSARLTAAGDRLREVSRLGDQAGAAPAKVWTAVPSAVARIGNRGAERYLGRSIADMARPAVDRALSSRPAQLSLARFPSLTAEGREARRMIVDGQIDAAAAQAPAAGVAQRLTDLLPSADEQAALRLIAEGDARTLAPVVDLPEFEQVARDLVRSADADVSPEALRLAVAYESGTLDPQTRARFTEARETLRPLQEAQTSARLSGAAGETPLGRSQLGDQPLSPVIAKRTQRLRDLERRTAGEADRASAVASRERALADARRAQSRPIAEPETTRQVLRRGEQIGATRTRLADANRQLVDARSQLDRAVSALVDADSTSTRRLADLAAEVEAAADRLDDVIDSANTTARRTQVAEAAAPGERRRVAPGAQRQLGAARERVRRERAAVRKAQRDLDTAATKAGDTPRSLSTAVAKAEQRLADAQATADRLTRELDTVAGTFLPEQPRSLRGTFAEGEASGRADQRARNAERVSRLAERRHTATRQRLESAIAEAVDSLEAAPARYRPALARSRRAVAELERMAEEADAAAPGSGNALRQAAAEIPTTLADMVDAGIDPEYLPGGRLRPTKGDGTQARLPQRRRLDSERVRTGDVAPFTASGIAAKYADEAATVVRNQTADNFAQQFGRAVGDVVDTEGLSPVQVAEAVREAGYRAWNPRVPFDEVPGAQVLGDNVVILPEALHRAFTGYFGPKNRGLAFEALGAFNRKWKSAVLPFSVRWHLGNITSNALMGGVGAGIDPVTLVRRMGDARRILKESPDQLPRRLQATGLTFNEMDALRPSINARQPGPVGRFIRRSFGFNEGVDNLYRSAVYLAKLDEARAGGRTTRILEANGMDPETYAVTQALRAMGDYTAMRPVERAYIREIMPFYAWARHSTQLALRLPIEHPVRVAWTLHLAEMFGQDQSELPPFARGGITFGGDRYLPVSAVNPFGDVLGSPLLGPEGFARSLSPGIKVPVAALTGINLSRGFDQATRPHGSGNLDEYGRPTFTPMIGRPSELANILVGQTPITRNLRDLVTGPAVRYDTGDVITSRGRPLDPGRGRLSSLVALAGIPTPGTFDAAQYQTTLERRRRQFRPTG